MKINNLICSKVNLFRFLYINFKLKHKYICYVFKNLNMISFLFLYTLVLLYFLIFYINFYFLLALSFNDDLHAIIYKHECINVKSQSNLSLRIFNP